MQDLEETSVLNNPPPQAFRRVCPTVAMRYARYSSARSAVRFFEFPGTPDGNLLDFPGQGIKRRDAQDTAETLDR